MDQPLKVVLMAGGRGERFWPRSRPYFPKQFLDMDGTGSLLRNTYERVRRFLPPQDIMVATLAEFRTLTLQELPELPEENLILEPMGRDTAASLGLAALWIEKSAPGAIMLALPADHLILQEDKFRETLNAAIAAAAAEPNLVTLGIHPSRPETGYGYIQVGPVHAVCEKLPVHRVSRFVEKPDLETARRYVDSGNYLWNGGMFAWQVSVFLQEIRSYMPELAEVLDAIAAAGDHAAMTAALPGLFPSAPKLSVDYGVLERSDRVVVVPAYFGWDDLGSWSTVERVRQKDAQGNVIRGEAVAHDASGLIIEGSSHRLIAAVGVQNLIVVDTDDAILVCAKDRAQDVKKVAALAMDRKVEPLFAPPVGRALDHAWGQEILWANTESYAAKMLEIYAGHQVPLHGKSNPDTFYVQSGRGRLVHEGRSLDVGPGSVFTVEPGTRSVLEGITGLVVVSVGGSVAVSLPVEEAQETATPSDAD